MGDTNQKYAEQIREARLFDDVMMTLAFDKNIECVQLMLRIILGRDDMQGILKKQIKEAAR